MKKLKNNKKKISLLKNNKMNQMVLSQKVSQKELY